MSSKKTQILYKITKWVFLSALGIVLLWDLAAQLFGGLESTVSWAIWDWTNEFAFVSFLVGFVCGHLFWGAPYRNDQKKKEANDEKTN